MADINQNLKKKAYGIMKSIETMSEKGGQETPSESFGQNYNNLRELVLQNNPNLTTLLPPPVKFADYGFNNYVDMKTVHSYSEIHTFCSELYHLLD